MPLNGVDWISLEVRTSQLNLSGGDDFQSIQDQKSLSMYFILKIHISQVEGLEEIKRS